MVKIYGRLKKRRKKWLVVCKVRLRTMILRDNVEGNIDEQLYTFMN
jgi:hypothetical protein